jgi:hypothetical protein
LLISYRRNVTRAFWLAGIAILFWVFPDGTMDQWLIAQHAVPGAPNGSTYLPLLLDYALGALLFVLVLAIGASLKGNGDIWRSLRWNQFADKPIPGLTALAVTSLGAVLIMWPLMGTAVASTKRLQVFFAVIASFALAAMLAQQLFDRQHLLWYWLAPLVVGIVGVGLAIASPAFAIPETYRQIDTLPAWWAVRPLPFEMLAGGWLGIILGLGLEKPSEEQEHPSL